MNDWASELPLLFLVISSFHTCLCTSQHVVLVDFDVCTAPHSWVALPFFSCAHARIHSCVQPQASVGTGSEPTHISASPMGYGLPCARACVWCVVCGARRGWGANGEVFLLITLLCLRLF